MADDRPALRELAARLGVEEGYRSALDGSWVATTDAAREALVAAMSFDGATEHAAERSLAQFEQSSAEERDGRGFDAETCLQGRSAFGVFANLYSVRSRRAASVGFGNFRDLEDLVGRAASEGGAFVGINPLHATVHRPGDFCPYNPVSRLFRDPLYLAPESVPGFSACRDAQRVFASAGWSRAAEALRRSPRLDVAGVESAWLELMRPLFARFRDHGADSVDSIEFDRYRVEQARALTDFATFEALGDHFEAKGEGRSAVGWRPEYQRADAPAVKRFREDHPVEVEWHAWLQFEVDRQLGSVAQAADRAGLSIGIYTDLALGSSAGGSDVWSSPDLYAKGVSVGAPPDAFSTLGQNWSFPPLDPHQLRRDGYRFWRRLLDANLRHAGALRIDHALALRRLFWIPHGAAPGAGAYVRYPTADLLTVCADASREHGALLIAEDLGTVPEGFSEQLQARGFLSSRVMMFERDDDGFLDASRYPTDCFVTANTHDLPPLAALEGDADLELRRKAGQIPDDATLERLRQQRCVDRRQLGERLGKDGFLDTAEAGDSDARAAAVTAFLCATPARLVGIALDDLADEDEPINFPGVPSELHASWVRRMSRPLDAIFESSRARRMLDAVPPRRRGKSRGS